MKQTKGDQTTPGHDENTKKSGNSQEGFLSAGSQRTQTAFFDHPLQKTTDEFSDHETGDDDRCRGAEILEGVGG